MKSLTGILLCVHALGLSAAATESPVFDIPEIKGITIDGKGADWGGKGFRVETLAGESGEVGAPKDFDPSFRLGWDERGLLVLVAVRCGPTTEADEPYNLWKMDGVELFFGEKPGSPQYIQILAGTGADPRFPKLRTFLNDIRKTRSPRELEIEVASSRTADGYTIEAVLPWSALGIKPHAGAEAGFQLYANHCLPDGSKLSVTWFPKHDSSSNPNSMAWVRLAAKASPPVLMAARALLDQGKPRVDVVAPVALAGEMIAARVNGKIVATNMLDSVSGRARTAFLLPLGDVEVSGAAAGKVLIAGSNFDPPPPRSIDSARIIFKPGVFGGEQFPRCDFERPAEAEKAMGKYVLTPAFYDADYREVKTAANPGCYGAIVQAKTESGQTFKRFITVYRTEGGRSGDQKWWYGLKKRTGDLRDDYYVHLPAGYENAPQKQWPLILFLHGSGERGYDIAPVKSRVTQMLQCRPDLPCIVVAPQCSPDEWWSPFELNDLLDRVEKKYRVDADRVYLTGLSMGGFGVWALAIESPQRFAAVVPICGGGDPDGAGRIKDIPIWVFHGGKDAVVPLQSSQTMVDALKKIDGNTRFTIFPDAGHDSWTQTYAEPELWDWLLQQHRSGTTTSSATGPGSIAK